MSKTDWSQYEAKDNQQTDWSRFEADDENVNPDEFTYGQRALQLGRGMAQGVGNIPDIASKYIMSPFTKATGSIAEQLKLPTKEKVNIDQLRRQTNENVKSFENPKVASTLTAPFDTAAGRSLAPTEEDLTGRIVHGTGEFLAPLPGTGYIKGAKAGIKGIGKVLGREAATSAGAATALEAKPKFTEKGTIGRGIEDFADTIIGARYGQKLSGKSASIAKDIYNTTKEGKWKQTIKEAPIKGAAKIVSKFSNPNAQTYKLAKEYGIDLPVNVGANNTTLNWLHNNYLKSIFASKSYKDVFNKADDQMFNKFKDSVDTLGLENVEPSKASARFRDFLNDEKKIVNAEVDELYNNAVLKSGKSNTVTPTNTIEDIHKFKSLLDRDVQAPDTKKVAKIIGELADSWGLLPKDDTVSQLKKQGYDDPRLLAQILEQIPKKSTELPHLEIGRLNEVRQELGKMIYDQDLRGAKGLLNSLRNSVTKDIESSANPQFIDKWKKANKFYRDNVAQRVESDLAHSMLTGEAPKEAFDAMGDVKGIKLVERISGQTSKGKQAFNDLKKAKLRDIFKGSIEGSYEDGKLSKAAFAKIFQKGEKGQEVLQELLGKSEYNKLADIAKISEEFSIAGKELLGTSGTAHVTADINRIQKASQDVVKMFLATAGGATSGYNFAGMTGALVGTAATIASPYLLSKLVSNPVFVREARIYALTRQAGKEKQAQSTLKKLFKISDAEARKSAQTISKMLNENEQEE